MFGIFRRKPLIKILTSNNYLQIDETLIDSVFVEQLYQLMNKSERTHREAGSVILIQNNRFRVYKRSTLGKANVVDLERVFVRLSVDDIKYMVGIVHTHIRTRLKPASSHFPSPSDIVCGAVEGFILGRDKFINMVLHRLKLEDITIMPAYECIETLYNMSPNVDKLRENIDDLYFYIRDEVKSLGEEYTREEFFLDYHTDKYPSIVNLETVRSMEEKIHETVMVCGEDIRNYMSEHKDYSDLWWEGVSKELGVEFVILRFHSGEYEVLNKYEVYKYTEIFYG